MVEISGFSNVNDAQSQRIHSSYAASFVDRLKPMPQRSLWSIFQNLSDGGPLITTDTIGPGLLKEAGLSKVERIIGKGGNFGYGLSALRIKWLIDRLGNGFGSYEEANSYKGNGEPAVFKFSIPVKGSKKVFLTATGDTFDKRGATLDDYKTPLLEAMESDGKKGVDWHGFKKYIRSFEGPYQFPIG